MPSQVETTKAVVPQESVPLMRRCSMPDLPFDDDLERSVISHGYEECGKTISVVSFFLVDHVLRVFSCCK